MNSHSILVIDDSPDSRDMYRELLSLDGYCVYAVATVDAARKVFREHRPPVVVIDDDPEGIHAVVIAAQLEQEAVALSEGISSLFEGTSLLESRRRFPGSSTSLESHSTSCG